MISRRIARELADQEFRNTYKRARVRSRLVYQIRALRKQRDWLQGKLAEIMRKPQSVVSRFEDPDYGKVTLATLFKISDAFDVGLIVEFVSYPEFLVRTSDLTEDRLRVPSFSQGALSFLTYNNSLVTAATDAGTSTTTISASQAGVVVAEPVKPLRDNEYNLILSSSSTTMETVRV